MFSKNKLGICFFVLAIIIALVNPFLITNPSIDNADPSSYIIVPIVMLPLLAAFIFKKKIVPKVESRDIIAGVMVFFVFVLLVLMLQLSLPYYFLGYRLDMLLFPIAIASFAMILFGIENLKRFKALIAYPALASPLLFTYLLGLNSGFAQANTVFVYGILHLFSSSIAYMPPFSISTGSYAIGIGTACAGIAVFVAMVLFLLPVAYLLEGKMARKMYWVASGFLLLLLLNFLRMSAIAAVWLLYGPNFATSFVHGFAGILLFYIAVIAIVLAAKRFGLTFPKIDKARVEKRANRIFLPAYALVVLLSLSYLLISSNYLSASILPAPSLAANQSSNFTSTSLLAFASSFRQSAGWNVSVVPSFKENLGILALTNPGFNSTNPIVILISQPNQTLTQALTRNPVLGRYIFVDQQLIPTTIYKIEMNQTTLFVGIRAVPYLLSAGDYTIATEYVIMPAGLGAASADCANSYDQIYTYVANLAMPTVGGPTDVSQLAAAYCLSERFV
ncbi:MAG: exosortase/archaeosortase family protein [Candidatus Micrarchaeota archaeon]|nr:exosortase/archaeosortase family protein [Candidatus Micrarchaeota archaeon]